MHLELRGRYQNKQVGKTIEYLPQCILRKFRRENQLFQRNLIPDTGIKYRHSILSTVYVYILVHIFYIPSVLYTLFALEIYQSSLVK